MQRLLPDTDPKKVKTVKASFKIWSPSCSDPNAHSWNAMWELQFAMLSLQQPPASPHVKEMLVRNVCMCIYVVSLSVHLNMCVPCVPMLYALFV